MTNVRDDKIIKSKFWRGSFEERRCLVPGDVLLRAERQCEAIHLALATVNHERMPVLLTKREEFEQWLNGSPAEALELAREYPPELMRIVREGLEKEDPWLEAA